MPWLILGSLSASTPVTVIFHIKPVKQFDDVYSSFFTDSRVTELEVLASAYVQALEGQVNGGKSGQ
jgi:hypothetical protein